MKQTVQRILKRNTYKEQKKKYATAKLPKPNNKRHQASI